PPFGLELPPELVGAQPELLGGLFQRVVLRHGCLLPPGFGRPGSAEAVVCRARFTRTTHYIDCKPTPLEYKRTRRAAGAGGRCRRGGRSGCAFRGGQDLRPGRTWTR